MISFQNAYVETIYASTGCLDGIENWINKNVPLICKYFNPFKPKGISHHHQVDWSNNCWHFNIYEQDKFRAQLS